ncbi:MAG: ribosome small subunit-dependent GTPase A [Defluviitaleaceae bacterium]|nr:ribosome small subunit-dependent GTPase A [Defluviitaleaceae bacterium]
MNKDGLITKGVGGLYTVRTPDGDYFCSARGAFRNKKISPLVGDNVEITIESEAERSGAISVIYPRRNVLTRPAVANIDRVIVTASAAQPAFNAGLLDRLLVLVARAGISAVICITKCDLLDPKNTLCGVSLADDPLFLPYSMAGYPLFFTSTQGAFHEGLTSLRAEMAGHISVFAGVSGAGKSSLINALLPNAKLETGEISTKLKRGKHTTRAAEILPLGNTPKDGYVVDTPGFSSLEIDTIPPREMATYFIEFAPYAGECKFNDCLHGTHDKEQDCAVKREIGDKIHPERYKAYVKMIGG